MKILARLAAISLVISIGLVYYLESTIEPSIESEVFCAYNKLFVRFREGRAVWGTMILDDHGSPIPCEIGKRLQPVRRIDNAI